ncbi:Lytic transglycosylase catalytic [Paenibacillus curdlanolyticus YK9]|uniref:Lytic transglycosylase catalytic n=1 Tax=Paenibacillus curdlanolyticus YK9 TaxID=717606 RepID=E0IF45_9BACL|nr:lytic transglycosylase domain-containing protein [Paenibacillus curdlanolyticus]EFM08821.1 Lytic transglycosylase catalytic [Paenibacillus curdlanolyticus YK9]
MKRRKRQRLLLLLIVGFVAFLFIKSDWMARWMYPIHYQEDIRASAWDYGLDPLLIAAVIRVETNYKTGKESHKGALGLMQIMPDTADWVINKAGFSDVTEDTLRHRADISIQIGSWYLSSLHKQFDGNAVAAVAAYNAGPGNVKKWMENGVWDGAMDTVSNVPFGETRHYVQRVFYYYNKYKDLYPTFG